MNVSQIPRQVFGGAAKKAVNVYQDYISADYNGERGAHCMYTPSCSAFMKEAVEQEGILQGSVSGLMRGATRAIRVSRRSPDNCSPTGRTATRAGSTRSTAARSKPSRR